jgi:hypothetical protein
MPAVRKKLPLSKMRIYWTVGDIYQIFFICLQICFNYLRFLKSRFGSIKKIRNYSLPIGITSAILGSCFIGLPQFFLIDSPQIWNPKTETWNVEKYYGFIRGQLLLIGILLLVIGLVLIIRYIRRNPHSTIKEKVQAR